jgi:hypothetical protein
LGFLYSMFQEAIRGIWWHKATSTVTQYIECVVILCSFILGGYCTPFLNYSVESLIVWRGFPYPIIINESRGVDFSRYFILHASNHVGSIRGTVPAWNLKHIFILRILTAIYDLTLAQLQGDVYGKLYWILYRNWK